MFLEIFGFSDVSASSNKIYNMNLLSINYYIVLNGEHNSKDLFTQPSEAPFRDSSLPIAKRFSGKNSAACCAVLPVKVTDTTTEPDRPYYK